MTYKGDNIIGKPTLGLIQVYIEEKSLGLITPQEVFDYWDEKEWKTKKGTQVKTLEGAINVYNGIITQKVLREINKSEKEERKQLRNVVKKIKEKNQKPKTKIRYSAQINDERWKAFRWFVMKVRGKSCEICGSTKCLQVHHIKYTKGARAWEYNVNEVMVVCRECHKKLHNIK